MSRLLVLFLALLLPLQFAWAGAAEYCQHETEPALKVHRGHHEHQHKGEGEGKKSTSTKFAVDADCHVCNATGTPLISSALVLMPTIASDVRVGERKTQPLTSALARAPDRPQWLRLA
jgi:hypothetical protein